MLPWDLLIVDEAHNFTPSPGGDDSQRCQTLREIAPYFEHRLFLTATPHNGYTFSFSGLLELLDPHPGEVLPPAPLERARHRDEPLKGRQCRYQSFFFGPPWIALTTR